MEKEKSLDYGSIMRPANEPTVYVIQEIAGTKVGKPKINIVGATRYGKIKVLLEENSQIIFSPGPIYIKLKRLLKDFKPHDYLLLTGDPAIILYNCGNIMSSVNQIRLDNILLLVYPTLIN